MSPRRILAFLMLLLGVLLPNRLRVLYSEALGWIAQVFHLMVRSLVRFIVRQAADNQKGRRAGGEDGSPGPGGADPPAERGAAQQSRGIGGPGALE